MCTTNLDPMAQIPHPTNLQILSYLTPTELGKVLRVNKLWMELASHDSLWKRFLCGAQAPAGTRKIDYFRDHLDLSNESFIESFLRKTAANTGTHLTMLYPQYPSYRTDIFLETNSPPLGNTTIGISNRKCFSTDTVFLIEEIADSECKPENNHYVGILDNGEKKYRISTTIPTYHAENLKLEVLHCLWKIKNSY